MPLSENSTRTLALGASSFSSATVVNAGVVLLEVAVGLAVCAATQIEQEAAPLWLG